MHLFAVLALFVSPFIFFNVYAEESQNTWKITIPNGASDKANQGFFPDELPVFVGDTIVWENKDSIIHSVTSGLPKFPEHSGLFFNLDEIKPGSSKSYVFADNDYNAFYYFCEIHPWMDGKFFLSDMEQSQPETDNPISLDKQDYTFGEKISVSGKVHIDFAGSKFTSLIYNQNDELVDISNGFFEHDSSYQQIIDTNDKAWNTNGDYTVKLVYAVPSKVAETNFQFSTKVVEKTGIPEWIKNVGSYWCNGKIDDSEFVSAIQYLIKQDIIELENYGEKSLYSNEVPGWVKNNACWWSDDKIPDIDFIFGIEYLVNIGTIRV